MKKLENPIFLNLELKKKVRLLGIKPSLKILVKKKWEGKAKEVTEVKLIKDLKDN